MRKPFILFFIQLLFVGAVMGQQIAPEQGTTSEQDTILNTGFNSVPETKKDRPKVGVVLSGGGAKGFAHIGALKVLEEMGIPIDYIAGTSMGAIVGGLYAIGYNTHTIDSLIKRQDWSHLLSDETYREHLPASLKDNPEFIFSLPYEVKIKERKGQVRLPPGVIMGQNLYSLFSNLTIGYQDSMDFNDLPIPFACVAADTRTASEVVLREGILPEAIRASMAIPGMFAPVEKDSLLLIDGGLINNYPVDVVREMGADIVIGVMMPADQKDMEKNRGTLTEVVSQLLNFTGQEKRSHNIANTDILITPDIYPYGMLDFESPGIDTIINRGEQAAMKRLDELMALKETLAIPDSMKGMQKVENPYIKMDTLEINSIRFEGLSKIEEKDIIKRIDINNNRIAREELATFTSRIYASGLFTRVYYRLDGQSPFDLVFTVEEKTLNALDIGLHFDTRDLSAILAHTSIRLNSSMNSVFDITARLSRNSYLEVNYSLNNGPFYRGGVTGKVSFNEIDIYEKGESAYKLDFTRSNLQLNFSEFYLYNIRLHLGAYIDNFHFRSRLRSEPNLQAPGLRLKDKMYINYFIKGTYDNLNKNYLPTSGQYFSFQYALHTDNLYQMYGKAPLNILDINFFKPFRLSDKLTITPEVSGRAIFNANDSIPLVYANFVGGQYKGHYVPQQIALQGSRGMELMKDAVGMLSTEIRYLFASKQHILLRLNGIVHHDEPLKLLNGKYFFGGSIGYSNLTRLGPLCLELGYSSLSKTLYPFASIGHYF
ncbi:patatin-like phospholipase family protein [Proteiniphilum sp.]|uniref:patatin-like phospholipase family protein n=1 Tax=Proteiniphilum sp. TaxID=1926877 RepID=UPI0033297568